MGAGGGGGGRERGGGEGGGEEMKVEMFGNSCVKNPQHSVRNGRAEKLFFFFY